MDARNRTPIESSISECDALLHALSDELASPDGAESASTLVEALVRKGSALRGACIAIGDPNLGQVAETLESCFAQMANAPAGACGSIEEARRQLESLRGLTRPASAVDTMADLDESRWVAVVSLDDEKLIGVPLDALSGAHPGANAGLRMDFRGRLGGGSVQALRLLEFVSMERTVADGAGTWPGAVCMSDGREARVVETAVDARPASAAHAEAA